jgi:hypothetical protein
MIGAKTGRRSLETEGWLEQMFSAGTTQNSRMCVVGPILSHTNLTGTMT